MGRADFSLLRPTVFHDNISLDALEDCRILNRHVVKARFVGQKDKKRLQISWRDIFHAYRLGSGISNSPVSHAVFSSKNSLMPRPSLASLIPAFVSLYSTLYYSDQTLNPKI